MGRLQTYQGKVRTKDNRCVSSGSGDCCCESGGGTVTCVSCNSSIAAATYLVTISGVTNGSCGSCSGYNGSFVLSFMGTVTSGNTQGCWWMYDAGSAACSGIRYLHFFHYLNGMYVSWNPNGTNPSPGFSAHLSWQNFSGNGDCANFSALNIANPSTSGGLCANSSSTCTVTAL